ncbi:aminotransferase class I/II-fold pyridoxal phosphate-dependent enzyme [Rhodobacteraceae bacterium RKSG542]|uniref:pyridoxal phosphate-dependent aminotransferase n=1 Tax=Pseudovibrio flavus TaxID=2529854 RepID=UPI0012BCAE86|nr:pyridoxal phosphate-dependent aminotransferase [Pseudovibrio flavus]MTI18828.1 aminotransferase class I/II-fold pyridoxal phosphate-dependent enzyme [Pseudovibrio flavus]
MIEAQHFLNQLSSSSRLAPESGIVELVNIGRERSDLIPLWAGEGQLSTPSFIVEAAAQSMRAGETFYTYQRGLPELRQALAEYHEGLYGKSFSHERFFVTGSGMHAIQLAIQAVVGPQKKIIVPSPVWPNLAAAAQVSGAVPVPVKMERFNGRWQLDIDRIRSAITPQTTAIFINSPCNPTGWAAPLEELQAILDLARENGLWIIADEVYHRFVFNGQKRAPSFYDIASDDDLILWVNSFSKNWAMTGWRVGWLSAPPQIGQIVENLIQYSTSGTAAFMQRAATVALRDGETFLQSQIDSAAQNREMLVKWFRQWDSIDLCEPDGAFYLFFSPKDVPDVRQWAIDLLQSTGVGLAPGTAFGCGGEGYVRLCFLRDYHTLVTACDRMAECLGN